ncbi:MAG TPA: hypothetical protein VD886_03810 [Herpetosiphonaceae bacterium]|nr:hypothetical protein [Herpetosiphonaceae bacterium]
MSDDQAALLEAHRATLKILLRQRALHGAAHAPPAVEHGIAEARREIGRLKALLAGRGAPPADDPDDEEPAAGPEAAPIRLTVHLAFFQHNNLVCYFVNATNLAQREVEITHVWFECAPRIHVLQPERPLPRRLRPAESWETWLEGYRLPESAHADPWRLARARLSTGQVVESVKNDDVIEQGYVPG